MQPFDAHLRLFLAAELPAPAKRYLLDYAADMHQVAVSYSDITPALQRQLIIVPAHDMRAFAEMPTVSPARREPQDRQ